MRFVTAKELRARSSAIWRDLAREGQVIVTLNGRPVALVTPTDERSLGQTLSDMARAKALRAMRELQEASVRSGRSKMNAAAIDREIAAARQERS